MQGILKGALLAGVLATGLVGTTLLLPTKPAAAIVIPAQRIQFYPGTDKQILRGNLSPENMGSYVLTATEGQQMSIRVSSPNGDPVVMTVYGVDGTPLVNGLQTWTGQVPATQDYFIRVFNQSGQPIPYDLTVTMD